MTAPLLQWGLPHGRGAEASALRGAKFRLGSFHAPNGEMRRKPGSPEVGYSKGPGGSELPGVHPSTYGVIGRHIASLRARLYAYALRSDIEVESSSVPINTFARVYWG